LVLISGFGAGFTFGRGDISGVFMSVATNQKWEHWTFGGIGVSGAGGHLCFAFGFWSLAIGFFFLCLSCKVLTAFVVSALIAMDDTNMSLGLAAKG
jgi:hypothetical protein